MYQVEKWKYTNNLCSEIFGYKRVPDTDVCVCVCVSFQFSMEMLLGFSLGSLES